MKKHSRHESADAPVAKVYEIAKYRAQRLRAELGAKAITISKSDWLANEPEYDTIADVIEIAPYLQKRKQRRLTFDKQLQAALDKLGADFASRNHDFWKRPETD